MAIPFPAERFVVEATDHAKTRRARNQDDILPFFVALKDLDGELFELARCTSVLEDLPHPAIVYTKYGMSTDPQAGRREVRTPNAGDSRNPPDAA
jgi:hypothetical protein